MYFILPEVKREMIYGNEYIKLFKDETTMAIIFQYPVPLVKELIKIGNFELINFKIRSTIGMGNGCISFRNYK